MESAPTPPLLELEHVSVQRGELMAIVTAAVTDETQPSDAASPHAAPARAGWKTLEQIAAEGRERHPKPVSRFGRSVELIRQMRDSR